MQTERLNSNKCMLCCYITTKTFLLTSAVTDFLRPVTVVPYDTVHVALVSASKPIDPNLSSAFFLVFFFLWQLQVLVSHEFPSGSCRLFCG